MNPFKRLSVNKVNIHWNLITRCRSFEPIELGQWEKGKRKVFLWPQHFTENFPQTILFSSGATKTASKEKKTAVSHWKNYTNFSFLYQRALLLDFPRRYFEIEINISFSFARAGKNQFSSNEKRKKSRKSFPLQYCVKRMLSFSSLLCFCLCCSWSTKLRFN